MSDVKKFIQGHRLYVNKTSLQHDSSGPIIQPDELEEVGSLEDAVLVSSQVAADPLNGEPWHTPILDLDFSAHLEPSTTPGHYHLYLDRTLPWSKYEALLEALAVAGLIEWGYYEASRERQATMVRAPGVMKGEDIPVSKQVPKKPLP